MKYLPQLMFVYIFIWVTLSLYLVGLLFKYRSLRQELARIIHEKGNAGNGA